MKSERYVFLITLFAGTLVYPVMAQEKTKIHEVGVAFSDLNRFGLTYRVGKENKRWRFNLIQSNIEERESSDDNSIFQSERFDVDLGVGREIRKLLSDKLYLRYGLDLTLGYSRDKTLRFGRQDRENDSLSKSKGWSVAASFVGGLNYEFNDHLLMGMAILPSFGYSESQSERDSAGSISNNESSGYFFRLSSGGALVSVIYTF
ncbi:MAG: hypothetical protein R8G66_03450 [Cytophagales bacterium]|nr:hypothetical protein [Cytophagales bacterium]